MLCPEVWRFSPPSSLTNSTVIENENVLEKFTKNQYFNHHISVTIPGAFKVPETLVNSLTDDSDFYHVSKLYAYEMVNSEFLDLFVRKGYLTLLSVGTKLDQDNCVAITPSGKLILSLTKKTYQQLGIDGKPSDFTRKNPERYSVCIDLRADCFHPGKKNYENVLKCLLSKNDLCFDVILSWEPHAAKVCPSSVAAYLSSKNYNVQLCKVKHERRIHYNVAVPLLDEETDPDLLIEWLGAFSLQCNLQEESDGYITTFQHPSRSKTVEHVNYLQWTGLFSSARVQKLVQEIRNYTDVLPYWVSISVLGFEDSVVVRANKEHYYYSEGDYHYTIFFRQNASSLLCSHICPSKRPVSVTKKKRKR